MKFTLRHKVNRFNSYYHLSYSTNDYNDYHCATINKAFLVFLYIVSGNLGFILISYINFLKTIDNLRSIVTLCTQFLTM